VRRDINKNKGLRGLPRLNYKEVYVGTRKTKKEREWTLSSNSRRRISGIIEA
jgi:hypothetical protein